MALTGNPKRLFVSAKDRVLNNDPQVSKLAVKDGFTQIERFLNTRNVTGGNINVNATSVTINSASFTKLPFGTNPVTWDTGNIINNSGNPVNTLTFVEPGLYQITGLVKCFPANTALASSYFVQLAFSTLSSLNLNVDEDHAANATFPTISVFSAIVPILQPQYVFVQAMINLPGAVGDTATLFNLAIAKIADAPSKFGQ